MEYTCSQVMDLPRLMKERSTTPVDVDDIDSNSPPSIQLLGSFHVPKQQITPNYYYNPHFNFPAVSWSTTDPTLLLTGLEEQHQQQSETSMINRSSTSSSKIPCEYSGTRTILGTAGPAGSVDASCCGFSGFPSSVEHYSSNTNYPIMHHAAGVYNYVADQIGLPVDTMATGSRDTISCNSIDPFSFSFGGSGAGMDPSHSQWMQACSLPSEQLYYNCSETLIPQLVSDYYSHSEQPCMYYTSSTSVDCCGVHEADSCGSSDRDTPTTSGEINWTNSSNGNSDMVQQQHQLSGSSTLPGNARGGGNSVTGLQLSPVHVDVTGELPDEHSSTIAAAADDVEFASGHGACHTTLDVRHQHRNTAAVKGGGAAIGRVSWMSPMASSSSSVQVKSHVTTLDPLLLLGSAAAAATSSRMQVTGEGSASSSLRIQQLPSSPEAYYKRQRRACYTLDSIPTANGPQPMSVSSQTCRISPRLSSGYPMSATQTCGISPRLSSGYPMAPLINRGIVDGSTTSSLYNCKDFHGFPSSRQGVVPVPPFRFTPAAAAAPQETNVGGFGSKREYGSSDQSTLLSPRKHNATSIEPQSVAARHRRKKISERVRILEKLIPGGNKMDTASMLDEAIEYVKFLQLQVQLLEYMGDMSPDMHSTLIVLPEAAAEGCNSFTTAPTPMTTTSIATSSSALHHHNSRKVDSTQYSAVISGLRSSHLSSALVQQSMIRSAAVATSTTANSPLIISEVLQEQLFKQKLCLVSLRQYCSQQQRPPLQDYYSLRALLQHFESHSFNFKSE